MLNSVGNGMGLTNNITPSSNSDGAYNHYFASQQGSVSNSNQQYPVPPTQQRSNTPKNQNFRHGNSSLNSAGPTNIGLNSGSGIKLNTNSFNDIRTNNSLRVKSSSEMNQYGNSMTNKVNNKFNLSFNFNLFYFFYPRILLRGLVV